MNHKYLFFCAVTAALAGFLFGFDTIVISGAEQQIQTIWQLSNSLHGLAISMALWGTVIGALFGGYPAAMFGRKKSLVAIGFLYFISAVGSGLAPEVYSFMIARFIGGLGVGASTVAAPMFISEIAPPRSRGKLTGMFQFNIVFGILVAFLSNWIVKETVSDETGWRWMLGIEALPALAYMLLSFRLPESPRWLITHAGKREEGAAVFREINPDFSDEAIEKLVSEVEASVSSAGKSMKERASGFWTSRLKVPILLAFLIAFFNQFSGINIILYFAPRLLELAGMKDGTLSSVSLGVTNLVFTFVGLYLIDRLGRRFLLYIGSVGYILSLGVCAVAFLSTPGLEVVSKAKDVVKVSGSVIAVEKGEGFITEEDKQELYKKYEAAKAALMQISKIDGYEGSEIVFSAEQTPEQVQEIATGAMNEAGDVTGAINIVVLIGLMAFIAAHAVGQGAVIWVFISEIFPNEHRAAGQSLGSSTHWVCAAVLTYLVPIALGSFKTGYLFVFLCFMMMLQLIWVKLMVPETKNVPLEELEKELGVKQAD